MKPGTARVLLPARRIDMRRVFPRERYRPPYQLAVQPVDRQQVLLARRGDKHNHIHHRRSHLAVRLRKIAVL